MSSESDNAMTSSTVSKLAEARRTTYLSGRWVCDDHNGDTSISITGPWITLPNNGDYSAYYNWVEEKKTTQGPGKERGLMRRLGCSRSHRSCSFECQQKALGISSPALWFFPGQT